MKSLYLFCSIITLSINTYAAFNRVILGQNRSLDPEQHQLINAVRTKDFDTAQTILNQVYPVVDVNFRDNWGYTPLHRAVSLNEPQMIKLLVTHQADVNAITPNDHSSPLMMAIKRNNLDVVRYLVEHGANINQLDKDGKTALDLAKTQAEQTEGDSKIVHYLAVSKLALQDPMLLSITRAIDPSTTPDSFINFEEQKPTIKQYMFPLNDEELKSLSPKKSEDLAEDQINLFEKDLEAWYTKNFLKYYILHKLYPYTTQNFIDFIIQLDPVMLSFIALHATDASTPVNENDFLKMLQNLADRTSNNNQKRFLIHLISELRAYLNQNLEENQQVFWNKLRETSK